MLSRAGVTETVDTVHYDRYLQRLPDARCSEGTSAGAAAHVAHRQRATPESELMCREHRVNSPVGTSGSGYIPRLESEGQLSAPIADAQVRSANSRKRT